MIVVNRYRHRKTPHDVNILRPHPLGNPFEIPEGLSRAERQVERLRVIADFAVWLPAQLADSSSAAAREFAELDDDSILVCCCKPAACHGDVIIEVYQRLKAAAGRDLKGALQC